MARSVGFLDSAGNLNGTYSNTRICSATRLADMVPPCFDLSR